jgi:hypothetical protein
MRWLAFLPFLAACGAPVVKDIVEPPPDRTPEVDQKYKEAAERGEVKLGMTRGEVRTAMRGDPKRTGKTTYRRRPATFWAYLHADIYFDKDGFVIGYETPYR